MDIKTSVYFEDLKPGKIILQADPHILADYLDSADRTSRARQYTDGSNPMLWMLEPEKRPFLYKYWEQYVNGEGFISVLTRQEDGALTQSSVWSERSEADQLTITTARTVLHRPLEDSDKNESAVAYDRIMKFLTERGADICMVSMPVTPLYLEQISEYPEYREALRYMVDLAGQYGATYVDLRNAVSSLDLFADEDHLNEQGTAPAALLIAEQCYGS